MVFFMMKVLTMMLGSPSTMPAPFLLTALTSAYNPARRHAVHSAIFAACRKRMAWRTGIPYSAPVNTTTMNAIMHNFQDTKASVRFAVFAALGQFLLTILILKLGRSMAPPEAFGKMKLLAFASTVIYPLILAHAFGLWKQLALGLGRIRPEPVFIASLATAALFLPWGLRSAGTGKVLSDVTIQFFNAFGEELLFRGVIFALLLSLPVWRGIVLNGLLFGAMHLIHGFMDTDWKTACWKMLVTSIAGMMFTAVRYRSGSLWLCVILHMTLNLCMIFSKVQDASESTVFMVERAANLIELAVAAWVIAGARRAHTAPALA
jgi:membrane protease YdiL (CAAX protease family)